MPDCQVIQADCLEWMREQPSQSVDFSIGSPPYAGKGERYEGSNRKWEMYDWIEWMKLITVEAVRITRGYVVWIANGYVRDGAYYPACEGLLWRVFEIGGVACERPCIWHKNAPPNRKDWFGNDWEFCLASHTQLKDCWKKYQPLRRKEPNRE